MIYLKEVRRYCKEYWKVENYDQAMADESQTWHCHHRKETDNNLTRKEMIAMGCYYNVPFEDLIFLTPEEHKRLHRTGKNSPMYGKIGPNKGKHFTEETKQKMSAVKKSENNPNYKYHITEEELYNLYVVQGLSTYKIAKKYGCSCGCIQYKLKKYNIKK